jgi:hypothetical protein
MEPVARKRGNQDTGSTFQGAKDTDARFNQSQWKKERKEMERVMTLM